jgi:hypothetical protein
MRKIRFCLDIKNDFFKVAYFTIVNGRRFSSVLRQPTESQCLNYYSEAMEISLHDSVLRRFFFVIFSSCCHYITAFASA